MYKIFVRADGGRRRPDLVVELGLRLSLFGVDGGARSTRQGQQAGRGEAKRGNRRHDEDVGWVVGYLGRLGNGVEGMNSCI